MPEVPLAHFRAVCTQGLPDIDHERQQDCNREYAESNFAMLASFDWPAPLPGPADPIYGVAHTASLQEQFLKAGLVDKNKVKLANQDKSKQKTGYSFKHFGVTRVTLNLALKREGYPPNPAAPQEQGENIA